MSLVALPRIWLRGVSAEDLMFVNARRRWAMREGSSRLMLIFRFEPQYTGTLPEQLPPLVDARLSDETKELMSFAHINYTKAVAAEWHATLPRGHAPRL